MNPALFLATALLAADPLGPGEHLRSLEIDGQVRSYLVHVPPQYDERQATPLVLAFHGAGTNGPIMALSTGLSGKSDEAGFVVAYPNGTGKANLFLVWNSGGFQGPFADKLPDDVKFVDQLLDDLAGVVNVDPQRVYATGLSNGGMMCYRLAAELSQRIAAIAPVAGTLAMENPRPTRPVPVIHFHGTADELVPFGGPGEKSPKFLTFNSVEETIRIWAEMDDCPRKAEKTDLPDRFEDGTTVRRERYGPGKDGAEVILYVIDGGGHTWPGRQWPVPLLGRSTRDIAANDLIWEFFQKHPMK